MSDGTYQPVAGNFIAVDYLKTAGLTLKKGRWFSDKRGQYEVVINETFAKARFGNEDPVGSPFGCWSRATTITRWSESSAM